MGGSSGGVDVELDGADVSREFLGGGLGHGGGGNFFLFF